VAQAPSAPDRDRDLASISEARALARRAKEAAPKLAEFTQEQIDAVVGAMAAATTPLAESLARLAHEETGYGIVADKIVKNRFASEQVYESIRSLKTVGIIRRLEDKKIVEIAEPFGVVCGIIPSTNPTSTAIYKILISLKARCPIVLSPHPAAVRCISRVAEVMNEAACAAGAPPGSISCMQTVTLEGTQELMKAREVAVILATGGMGLVRAAYSAGKPAYGVGPGNAPAFIERTADVQKAVLDIVTGKTFDNGVLCSSENSVVLDEPIAEEAKRQFVRLGAYFMSPSEIDALGKILVTPQRLPNPALVGKLATYIAEQAGIKVPPDTRVLIAELNGVGRDYPLSIEKLCPVLSMYTVRDWREGCERCIQILRYGGMGHTMAIHSRNEEVILQFGLKKPAFRIVVNTPTTHGSIGYTTGLDPAMTLGCGGFGGNITSDNIAPRHLLNIKRLAYEVRPAPRKPLPTVAGAAGTSAAPSAAAHASVAAGFEHGGSRLPQVAKEPKPAGISADTLSRKVDEFLATRGFRAGDGGAGRFAERPPGLAAPVTPSAPAVPAARAERPSEFVCEEDVRQAVRHGKKITIGERTIVTPAARDLGQEHKIFIEIGFPQS
jgi:acetaldehyde dehydrogenase (acetylating)